jgi:hypothetical protein
MLCDDTTVYEDNTEITIAFLSIDGVIVVFAAKSKAHEANGIA